MGGARKVLLKDWLISSYYGHQEIGHKRREVSDFYPRTRFISLIDDL